MLEAVEGSVPMATPIEQLDAMKGLPENWDGYGAAVPIPEAIELAKDFVRRLITNTKRSGSYGVFVAPGRDGGVQIEWTDATYDHELEINPDGSIGMLHVDRTTGAMDEERFEPPSLIHGKRRP